jgi:nicotinamidase-related amidase
VQHGDDDLRRGTPQWQWVPQLAPRDAEPLVHKSFNSAFEDTELETVLADIGATHIVLAGAATNWCIRATAYGALDRGYDLTLVKDAHTTETMELADGTKIEAARIVDELNIAMKWLSYPGRVNRTASAADVDYASAAGSSRR